MNKRILLSIILFLFACSEKEDTTIIHSHPNLPELDYELKLQSDSGENLESVTISWQEAGEIMRLKDGNEIHEILENSYVYDSINPGEFKDLQFALTLDDTTYFDTMQIFTRSVLPITNFITTLDEELEYNGYWDEEEFYEDGNGAYDLGEDFEDGNDTYDFKDIDGDGVCNFTGFMEAGTFTSNECEPFTDSDNGQYDPWEIYVDSQNGQFDAWESYEDGNDTYDFKDIDGDGGCDFTGSMEAGTFTSNECEPFTDSNNGQYDSWETYVDGNGQYDVGEEYIDGNGIYDIGEEYIDSDNGQYDSWETFTDSQNGQRDLWETYQDGNGQYDFKDIDGDGKCDFTGFMEAGTFTSNECEPFTDSEIEHYDSWMQFINDYSNIGSYDPWENFIDSDNEEFDPWEWYEDGNGQYDVGEEYEDGNGVYDFGENFIDCNDNQTICSGDVAWDSSLGNNNYDFGENFTDSENGQYDSWETFTDSQNGQHDSWETYQDGNGQYDFGEEFTDSVADDYDTWNDFINTYSNIGAYDPWENFIDSANGQFDPWEWYEDGNGNWDENESYQDGNGVYDFGEEYEDSDNEQHDAWESYTDSQNGQFDPWESYVDGNGIYDVEEEYIDSDNGQYDPWESYVDGNGQYDFGEEYEDGNLQYDVGEEYIDSDNGQFDPWENYVESGNGFYEPWEDFIDEPSSRYYRKLSWEKTEESQSSESAYIVYRVTQDSLTYLINPSTCECSIDTISSFQTNFYDDSDSLVLITENPLGYYYRIQVLKDGHDRYSFINHDGWPNPEKISLTENDVSTDKDNYVEINWDPITEQTYFYQYEIYRTLGPISEGNDTTGIAIMTNPNINHFLDRTAGNGTTYSYSIAVVDVTGKREYSDFILGLTRP